MTDKLIKNIPCLLTLFFAMFGAGAALAMMEEPAPGDGFFLLYAVIGFVLSGAALLRQPKSQSLRRKNASARVLITLLMLVMALGGILAAAALALNASRFDQDYLKIALIAIIVVFLCGSLICWVNYKRRHSCI